jgi:hypothetical protein
MLQKQGPNISPLQKYKSPHFYQTILVFHFFYETIANNLLINSADYKAAPTEFNSDIAYQYHISNIVAYLRGFSLVLVVGWNTS